MRGLQALIVPKGSRKMTDWILAEIMVSLQSLDSRT